MKFKMADDKKEEIISEAVRKYPILYDKSDRFFKEKDKKKLAWQDVANVANIANGKSLLSFYSKFASYKNISVLVVLGFFSFTFIPSRIFLTQFQFAQNLLFWLTYLMNRDSSPYFFISCPLELISGLL